MCTGGGGYFLQANPAAKCKFKMFSRSILLWVIVKKLFKCLKCKSDVMQLDKPGVLTDVFVFVVCCSFGSRGQCTTVQFTAVYVKFFTVTQSLHR